MKVAVIGAGSWGTALALVLGDKGHDVALWSYDPEVAEEFREKNENTRYLPGIPIPTKVQATSNLEEALSDSEMVVLVSPSHVTRQVVSQAVEFIPHNIPLVCATKGIENGSLMTMSEVLEDVLPPHMHPYLSFLSGPSFAKEVALRMPTAVTVASRWERIGLMVQQAFAVPMFRVYTSPDVVGVEFGGSLKNVMAIAAGISDGMGFGHNARSGLITRGLAEIGRLAVRKGAHPLTLSGLSGMGDLVLTCTGELSRNRGVGLKLGQGQSLDEILGGMQQVAEGVKTTQSAWELAQKLKVDMPITDAVHSVLYRGVTPRDAVESILARELKPEFD